MAANASSSDASSINATTPLLLNSTSDAAAAETGLVAIAPTDVLVHCGGAHVVPHVDVRTTTDDEDDDEVLCVPDPAPYGLVCKSLLHLAVPTSVSFVGYFSVTIIAQVYSGRFGVDVVAGYGLATMIVNSVAFAAVTGLCGGLDTLISQAYGKSPSHKMISIFAQRGIVCFQILMVPMCILFGCSRWWLSALSFADEQVVDVTASLLEILVVMLPVWVLSEVLMTTLTAVNATVEVFLGTIGSALLHPLTLYLILDVWNAGFQGLAVGWAITITMMFVLTCLASIYTKSMYSAGFTGWNCRESMRQWRPLLSMCIPAMGIMLCEWSAFEVNVMLSARFLSQEVFAAVVICQQLYCAMLPIPVAMGYATTVKVGNYVGAKKPETARRAAMAGIVITVTLSAVGATVLALARTPLSSLFSSHPHVQQVAVVTLPAAAVMFVFDASLGAFTAVLRGVGEPGMAAICTTIGWWVIGIPCAILLHYFGPASLGAKCFYYGPTIGIFVACCLTAWLVFCKIEYVENDNVAQHFEDSSSDDEVEGAN
jgi:multidrug resistance protein, MATE family